MDKNKELAKNTFVFGIGTIGSKLMQFLLVPLYTIYLTSEEFSAADLIVSSVFLMSPLFTLGVGNGILRFVLEHEENRGPVLKLSFLIAIVGACLIIPFIPYLNSLKIFSGYGFLIPILLLCYSLKNIFAQYCKAIEKNLIYSLDGIFSAITLTIFSLILIVFLHYGVLGYVLSMLLSLFISILYFVFNCGIASTLIHAKMKKSLSVEVLKYAIPLMPNELSWWIIQMSNRYILVFYCGAVVNGVFSMAYKLPGIFNLIVSIFIQAFGVTAIKECNLERKIGGKYDGAYFEKIFKKYTALTFIAVVLVILLCKPLAYLFLKNEFFEAWKYMPFLLCAYAIGNLQSFYGSIYGGLKKTNLVLYSTLIGAVVCFVSNLILVPAFAAYGACISAVLGYFAVYIARLYGLKKNVVMCHFFKKNFLSILIVLGVSIFYISEDFCLRIFSLVLSVALLAIYFKDFQQIFCYGINKCQGMMKKWEK